MEFESQNISTTLLRTADQYMQIFATLDPDVIYPIQTETYKHEFAPMSADPPPALTRDTFASHIIHLREILRAFPVHTIKAWANPSLNQVTIWAKSETEFHDHVKDNSDEEEWKYRGEYFFVLTMDHSGQRIDHVLEFLDSKGTDTLRALMVRARKKKQQAEEANGDI